ncbi:hypothetical protein, partial [Escherichia coli]|uniref:hypothetical protein n=1 Tax=Escherichia coli TaxID=562 RepID=UPI001BAEA860
FFFFFWVTYVFLVFWIYCVWFVACWARNYCVLGGLLIVRRLLALCWVLFSLPIWRADGRGLAIIAG